MKRYVLIFFAVFIILTVIFFLFRIPIFDGEIVFENGVTDITAANKLSLSYFLGFGLHEGELIGVNDFHLTPTGYLNVFLLIFALPLVITYRVYLAKNKKRAQQK